MDKNALIRALRDTAQSASNAIASNISGPVDLIAAGLRAGGLPINNPVGGSQWMAEKGLTRDVEMGVPRIVGETLGMAGPAVVAAKAPQIAAAMNQAGRNLAAPRTMNPQTGAIVWHGSPHKFDKFDSSKIGTGEGAQAYGHGLYLAEAPEVAREYQRNLSSTGGAKNLVSQFGDVDSAINEATRRLEGYKALIANGGGGNMRRAEGMLRITQKNLQDLQDMKAGLPENTGALYKVDLPDEHIAKMLDWDKPLSQQAPEVRMLAKDLGISEQEVGAKFYQALTNQARDGAIARGKNAGTNLGASQAAASDDLRAFGIPGIRYLDGGSRGTGQGTSNFVVFPGNEDILKILERNGQPLGMMGIR